MNGEERGWLEARQDVAGEGHSYAWKLAVSHSLTCVDYFIIVLENIHIHFVFSSTCVFNNIKIKLNRKALHDMELTVL